VPALEQHVGGRDHATTRRLDDRGVVAGPELDAGARSRADSQPRRDPCDDPELAEFPDGDDPPPAKTRYGDRLNGSPREDVMVQAYILIQTEVGKAADVAREISGIQGVTLAEDVTGPYDVIVRAEANNVDELGKLVVAQIQSVEGITRTLTCPIVHI
jgi:DNA-binding Lrp family transcriptional regulator